MRNKKLFDLLETDNKSLIKDDEIEQYANSFCLKDYKDTDIYYIKDFISQQIISNPANKLSGYSEFPKIEYVIGVTQFIDNLVMKYGINGLQILEHDYTYYQRLNANIKYAEIGNLDHNKPLVMSMPFAGHCDIHKQMSLILDECTEKSIDVHLDCAWLTCASGIEFNFAHPCIKSFASSLSKAYSLGWNRIGIRWSRYEDDSDSVTVFNRFNMFNDSLCKIGYHMVKKFPIDFYWKKYRNMYLDGCRKTFTFPTKIIWLSKGLNGELYGTSKLLHYLQNVGVCD